MTREEAHKLVDALFDNENTTSQPVEVEVTEEAPTRVLPEGKRVVRTKSSGDRVYYIDEDKKTRQWVTNADVLTGLGFQMEDVSEVEDVELLRYQMSSAIYKVDAA
jgi:hypothetical protein